MLGKDLVIDPYTGLLNLFGLIEETAAHGLNSGAIVVADIANLDSIIKEHGRKSGDICVRILAGLLRAEADQRRDGAEEGPLPFRIGDNEFLLFLPGGTRAEAEDICARLSVRYREKTLAQGISEADIYLVGLECGQEACTALGVLRMSYLALAGGWKGPDAAAGLPPWAEGLIESLIAHTRETLVLLRQTRSLALSDEISGLPNYRAARIFLESLLRDYADNREPFSILLIDGDNLKQYNNLGYRRGNQMIRDLASLISESVRIGDQVARWLSGDEFLVLLPGAEREKALAIGERIRSSVDRQTRSWDLPITVSIGVASCPKDGMTADDLLTHAEKANTLAKRAGKNQVT